MKWNRFQSLWSQKANGTEQTRTALAVLQTVVEAKKNISYYKINCRTFSTFEYEYYDEQNFAADTKCPSGGKRGHFSDQERVNIQGENWTLMSIDHIWRESSLNQDENRNHKRQKYRENVVLKFPDRKMANQESAG